MLKYQQLDQEIVRLEGELGQNGDRKNAIKMQQLLKDYQAKLMELNKSSEKLAEDFEKYRGIFNQMAENLEVVNKNLAIKDEKKIDGLIEASDAITNNLLRLEKKLSAIINDCNSVQAEYASIMKNARTAKTNLEKYKEGFANSKAQTEKKIEEIKKELETLSKSVDKTLMAKYKQKRSDRANVFVEEINGRCGGCRMEISASKKAKLKLEGMIECENCQRIIYIK